MSESEAERESSSDCFNEDDCVELPDASVFGPSRGSDMLSSSLLLSLVQSVAVSLVACCCDVVLSEGDVVVAIIDECDGGGDAQSWVFGEEC